ncbi:MAG: acyl-CoA/acyl-ACP dehydrogenase [Chloroflexi bacterium]|nr:acyl-CoA/acyl-ACP dehydrogenase [Chloroflexota bacterium]
MNLDLTEEQQMLKTAARDFFTKEFPKTLVRQMEEDPVGHSPGVWKKMADLGWIGLVIPEEYGGSGLAFMDLVFLLEEMGRACLPGPFFSTAVLCTLPILAAGSEQQKKQLLPEIAGGKTILSLALTEPSATYEAAGIATRAVSEKDSYVINGTKLFVHDAHIADYLLCVARTGAWSVPEEGISLFLVDARSAGVKITPLLTIADDRQNEVVFQDVVVPAKNLLGQLDQGWPVVKRLVEQAAIAKCAEMIGGADWVVEATVAYAKERVQYGKPIGTFGSIQHALAEMWTEVNMAKRLTYYAAWAMEQGLPCSMEVAMAKEKVNEAYKHSTRMGVQLHGAIGTTRDHDMGLYYRRARQGALLFGDSDYCREVVARQMGM